MIDYRVFSGNLWEEVKNSSSSDSIRWQYDRRYLALLKLSPGVGLSSPSVLWFAFCLFKTQNVGIIIIWVYYHQGHYQELNIQYMYGTLTISMVLKMGISRCKLYPTLSTETRKPNLHSSPTNNNTVPFRFSVKPWIKIYQYYYYYHYCYLKLSFCHWLVPLLFFSEIRPSKKGNLS